MFVWFSKSDNCIVYYFNILILFNILCSLILYVINYIESLHDTFASKSHGLDYLFEVSPKSVEDCSVDMDVNTSSPKSFEDMSVKQIFVQDDIAEKLHKILSKFAELVNKVRIKLNAKKVSVEDLRCYLLSSINLKISHDITTINEVFAILNPHLCYSLLLP